MPSLETLTVPFHVSHTLYRVHGLLRLEFDQLVLEFQSVENVLGLIRGPIRTLTLRFAEIDDIHLEKGFWGGRHLIVRTRHLKTLNKFPGSYQGSCVLQIRRGNTFLAEQIASQLALKLAEAQLDALNNPDAYQALPPAQNKLEQAQILWNNLKDLFT